VDYYSEEFEPDGSLRLYNNGKHPEIEAFVTWMWEGRRREEARDFVVRLRDLLGEYTFARIDEGNENWGYPSFGQLSPQMYDALARADADPDYVLDLVSIRLAGY